ncbi:hypothetical protein SAMN06269250_3730 [Spirosoma fluviale]|uniref:Uncharacterized protein n=1 Tax=Spirosoma fluviale TaxID=1597977 RepID=A0A286G9R7_9BACT|nr:hypothetical protein SAMN06269250_3730 [Spirosoma fluviale]
MMQWDSECFEYQELVCRSEELGGLARALARDYLYSQHSLALADKASVNTDFIESHGLMPAPACASPPHSSLLHTNS